VRSLLWEVHVGIRGMVATEINEKEGTNMRGSYPGSPGISLELVRVYDSNG
jgi:hypothetical protein